MSEIRELPPKPPRDIEELLRRAQFLSGRTLGELASDVGEEVPVDLRHAKGWVGRLLEVCLGATAGNLPVPDFEALGIELKTIPTDAGGKPRESTYVCTVPLTDVDEAEWESSTVRTKLRAVLWVPILADNDLAIAERMVGRAFLWRPSDEEEGALRRDWEKHLRVIREGFVDNIRGADGEYLQIRPKAADSRTLTEGVDDRGEAILTSPRGFYLRTLFTEYLIKRELYGSRCDAVQATSVDERKL